MAEVGPADALAAALYAHLQAGRHAELRALLPELCAAAGQRPALLARAWAWSAQSAMDQGQLDLARAELDEALRLARAARDPDGIQALRELQKTLLAMIAARSAPQEGGGRVAEALAAFDRGEAEAGRELALFAQAEAEDPRARVLALLAMARHPEEREGAIRRAAALADASGDMNLVTAVARAARASGVELGVHIFDGRR
jgi:hypothetical protein